MVIINLWLFTQRYYISMINLFNYMMTGGLSFLFFCGDLSDLIHDNNISDYGKNYTPRLNYYLLPVIVIINCCYVLVTIYSY